MKRIAIIGPESTGKSTLSELLAQHYGGVFIPEYARTYIEQLQREYTKNDVEIIARAQIDQFESYASQYEQSNTLLFFDTELIITKVWMKHCFDVVPSWVQEALVAYPFDLYLICKPDLPWVDDPVRENPNIREYLYDWYVSEALSTNTPFVEIGGTGSERLTHAILAVEQLVLSNDNK